MKENYNDIVGAGGGKSGGSGGHEASDTLVTDQIIKVLHLLGEGVCNLATGDGRSIYLNNTPLQNADMSYNFVNCAWDFRSGTATQSPMTNPAFPSGAAIMNVNQEFTGGTTTPLVAPAPVIYNVTSALTDYCKIGIQFPNGLANVDSHGNIVGDTVSIAIDTKPHSGSTWTQVIAHTFNDKSNTAAIVQFQVNRDPGATGALWDIRCRRITQDNSSATRHNNTVLYTVEEVEQIVLPYNGVAYCGIALDAKNLGGMSTAIPVMSFLMQGVTVKIPSNYNPATAIYTGLWDGTFTTGVTDNPAWILYDMLTNANYGCGLLGITPAMIDKYSFYNAGVFCDGLVSSGVGAGTERRFTFNAPIQNRKDMLTTLMEVAGMMNSVLGIENGLISLFQDRPTTSMYVINKSNVIQDDKTKTCFTYASSALPTRTTAVNVTYTNAADLRYLPKTTSVSDTAGLARYGYQSYDLAAFGATTEGQAIRAGRWWLFSNLYVPEQVTFKMGLEGLTSNLYDVFDLYDEDYTGRAGSGRVVSATSSTVTLDQPVIIDGTSPTISVLLADGVTYETHAVTSGAGTYSTLSISGTWSALPTQYCPYVVASAIAPRTFRIVDLKIDGVTKEVTITAQVYNSGNYSYIEEGITLATPTYTTPDLSSVKDPTSPTFTQTQYLNPTDGTLQRGLLVQWVPPTTAVSGYVVKWRKDNGTYQTSNHTAATSFELFNVLDGQYDFIIFATNIANQTSPGLAASYTYVSTGGGSSTLLSEITGLSVSGGGTTFSGQDCSFTWANPTANQGLLKDFVVNIINPSTSTILRTVIVPAVNGGSSQSFVYTFAMNVADGGPNRSIEVKVQGRDSWNNTTAGDIATFTNPAPAAPTGITATGLQNSVGITWTASVPATAVAGYIIWGSQSSGFTPSSATVIYQGNATIFVQPNLSPNATWYYKMAAYDVFSSSLTGSGLNLSGQFSSAVTSTVGIAGVSSLPGSGTEGQVVFNTTDGQLYRYHAGAWTTAVPAVNVTGTLTASQIASVNAAAVGAGLTAAQISSVAAATVTGTIGTTQIANNAITTPLISAGAVVSASIAAGTIVAGNIAAGTITGSNIAASTISAANLVANTITAGQINAGSIQSAVLTAGSVTGTTIAGNTITASNLVANTITAGQIAANTITSSQIAANTITAANILAGTITASQIAANTITGGNIASGSIAAAQMATGTITAASGIIANAAVGTLQIAGQAVTFPVAAFTAAAYTLPATVNITIQTLTYTSTGVPTIIMFSHSITSMPTSAIYSTSLYRGGTLLYQGPVPQTSSQPAPFAAFYMESPPAGSVTYTMVFNTDGIGGSIVANRLISAVEYRR